MAFFCLPAVGGSGRQKTPFYVELLLGGWAAASQDKFAQAELTSFAFGELRNSGANLWGEKDSNLRRHSRQIYSLLHLTALVSPLNLKTELEVGIEPTTYGLQNRCSTS